jgi:hypothetical protein
MYGFPSSDPSHLLTCSRIAAGLQKPNLLKHSSQMAEWAQELKADREHASDESISYLISLRHIDDQIQDTLFTADAIRSPSSDARTLLHVRFMESQLGLWEQSSSGATSQRCAYTRHATAVI